MSTFNRIRLTSSAAALLALLVIGCSKGGYTTKIRSNFNPSSVTVITSRTPNKDGQMVATGLREYKFKDGEQEVNFFVRDGVAGQSQVTIGEAQYQVTDTCFSTVQPDDCGELVSVLTRTIDKNTEGMTFLLKNSGEQPVVFCSLAKKFDSAEAARTALTELCAQPSDKKVESKPVEQPAAVQEPAK